MLRPDILERLLKKAQVKGHRPRCLLLCQVVDDFCPPPPKHKGPGRPVTFSDNMRVLQNSGNGVMMAIFRVIFSGRICLLNQA